MSSTHARRALSLAVAVVAVVAGLATPAGATGTSPARAAIGIVQLVNNVSGKCVEVKDRSTSESPTVSRESSRDTVRNASRRGRPAQFCWSIRS